MEYISDYWRKNFSYKTGNNAINILLLIIVKIWERKRYLSLIWKTNGKKMNKLVEIIAIIIEILE